MSLYSFRSFKHFLVSSVVILFSDSAYSGELYSDVEASKERQHFERICRHVLSSLPLSTGTYSLEQEIAQTISYEQQPGFRGLRGYQYDLSQDHEVKTGSRYAQFVSATKDEHFALITNHGSDHVVAFDGIIFDSNGKATANVSMKRAKGSKSLHHRLNQAVTSIEMFSTDSEPWFSILDRKPWTREVDFQSLWKSATWMKEVFLMLGVQLDENYFVSTWLSAAWMKEIFLMFGIRLNEDSRRTRIVIDFGESPYDFRYGDQNWVREFLDGNGKLIESVTLLLNRELIRISKGGQKVERYYGF